MKIRFDLTLLVVILLSVLAVCLESVSGYRQRYGRWLLVAGTHRYANAAGNSDMARETAS